MDLRTIEFWAGEFKCELEDDPYEGRPVNATTSELIEPIHIIIKLLVKIRV